MRVAGGVVSLWGSWGTVMTHASGHVQHHHARNEHHLPNTAESDSCEVPEDGSGSLSALARGGCIGLMVKQSVSASWVADLICKHSK